MGERRLYRAKWILPVASPPLRDAWVAVEDGRIAGAGEGLPPLALRASEIDLGAVAVLPGLVNAHTHLELSWMRGLISPTVDFPGWIRSVIALQREGRPPAIVEDAVRNAVREGRAFGTALVGDITNTLATPALLKAENMAALVFYELIGFREAAGTEDVRRALARLDTLPAADLQRYSLAAHAPYSVSPRLFDAIFSSWPASDRRPVSVHVGESAAETEFLQTGTGPWRQLLVDVGAWNPRWTPPASGAVEYLDRLGVISEGLVAVHGLELGHPELKRLRDAGSTLVTCPRGNLRTGAGVPPISRFYESGVRVAVGTDSLASVPDLNLFAELAEMRRLAPGVPARSLLESATLSGARALGFGHELGTIESGKLDRLIAVDLEAHADEVEEFLVNGIDRSQIHWL